MMANKSALSQKFAAMSPKKRMWVAGGGIFVLLAFVGTLMSPSGPPPVKKPKNNVEPNSLAMPGGGRDLSFEKLAAQVEATRQDLDREKEKSAKLEKEAVMNAAKPAPGTSETLAELQKLKADIEEVKKKPSLDDELPASAQGGSSPAMAMPIPEPEQPKLRILGGAPRQEKDADSQEPQPIAFLPAGSNFEGILLNGMDAPTSAVTMKNPVPALLRLKTDAILPNRHRYDVKECFVIVSGFGVLSTERAQLQLVSLSCVKTDGSVIETKLDGYIVGEDGKVGMRGRLVSRQGQIIAKSMLAGFFSGLAQNMAPSAVPQLNVNPGANTQYQLPSLSNAATAGAAQGVATSASAISKFYLDMAKDMFPVIEIDAQRRATIILTKGVELNVNSGKDK